MIRFRPPLLRLTHDQAGATIVEFAILAPAVIGLMLGVLQIGKGMQSYNAVRNASADIARYAVVEYQKGEDPDNERILEEAESIAEGAPYLLQGADFTLVNAEDQEIDGAREITLTITYDVPIILPLLSWDGPTITHSRPIFVLE